MSSALYTEYNALIPFHRLTLERHRPHRSHGGAIFNECIWLWTKINGKKVSKATRSRYANVLRDISVVINTKNAEQDRFKLNHTFWFVSNFFFQKFETFPKIRNYPKNSKFSSLNHAKDFLSNSSGHACRHSEFKSTSVTVCNEEYSRIWKSGFWKKSPGGRSKSGKVKRSSCQKII